MTIEEKAKEFDRAIMRAKEIDVNKYGDIVTHILPSFKEIEEQENWEQILSYIPDDALTDWAKKQIEKHKETVKKMESYQKRYFDVIKHPVWDIKCAVRGDILVADYGYDIPWMGMFKSFNDDKTFNTYCFLSGFTHTFIVNHNSCTNNCTYNVRPATDKEKFYFISTMIENGYVWDDKKKELKKIENKETPEFEFVRVFKTLPGTSIYEAARQAITETESLKENEYIILNFNETCIIVNRKTTVDYIVTMYYKINN